MTKLTLDDTLKYYQKKYLVKKRLEDKVTSEGFIMVEPAYFEDYERFVKMNKRIKKDSMVQVLSNDGNLLILRPDATTSIIKELMPKWRNNSQLKVFYDATTFTKNQNGLIEEKQQFGTEILGGNIEESDRIIFNLALDSLKTFKLQFIIEVNNSKFLNGLFKALNLTDNDEQTLKEIIYYKNTFELDRFISESSFEPYYKDLLKNIFTLQGSLEEIDTLLNKYPLNKQMIEGLNELTALSSALSKEDLNQYIRFDLSLLSKYDYYNGLTFKGYIQNVSTPILNGGRYDPLTKLFGLNIEAIGFSINTTDILKEASIDE
ncbi:MAG: ATP phosphoribosyltransferase regulatory subunit [Candidatus Izemoplasmataceae bacterium]